MTDEQALHLAYLCRELQAITDHVSVHIDNDSVHFDCMYRSCNYTHDGPEEIVEEYVLFWDMDTRPSVDELVSVDETRMG